LEEQAAVRVVVVVALGSVLLAIGGPENQHALVEASL
jgi:hypothetical protein